MNAMDGAVIAGGLAVIAWINWYFFIASRAGVRAAVGTGGGQQITIAVEGGYEPAVVHVKKDVPVRLVFDRRERSGCSEEVVMPEFGIRIFLPAFRQTAIDVVPKKAGTVEFACGMGMLRGRLVVLD